MYYHLTKVHSLSFKFIFYFFMYSKKSIYFWLRWVSVEARGLSSCGAQALLPCSMWDLSSLTRD